MPKNILDYVGFINSYNEMIKIADKIIKEGKEHKDDKASK